MTRKIDEISNKVSTIAADGNNVTNTVLDLEHTNENLTNSTIKMTALPAAKTRKIAENNNASYTTTLSDTPSDNKAVMKDVTILDEDDGTMDDLSNNKRNSSPAIVLYEVYDTKSTSPYIT
eukprot:CAMPEP_0172519284 /NCGR_PEP_ID=MMETSP1066-20121228/291328_1 /TAXON_ID=671091 /ORGANISM="Coscinodiscus wailesii, Strain CCMP2513" /LENGTH=120 /DNA_ID=CAMNT_0013301847 /DNA_START=625 /DNA_END=987 /DNA_ORIENTATION=-